MIEWIKEKITGFFVGGYFTSLLRKLLLLAAGYLVAQGHLTQAEAEAWMTASDPVLQAAVLALVAVIWSWIGKAKVNAKLASNNS